MTDLSLPGISLFSGIGGLDLGARLAGFDLAMAVDNDGSALACIEEALGVTPLCTDLSSLSSEDLRRFSSIPKSRDSILIGGPPCTAFSHAGFWIERKRSGDDEQIGRIADFLRFIADLRPRAFLMENVPGLLFKNYRHIFSELLSSAKRFGYSISYTVLNAADFGVPQKRRRLFVVGLREPSKPFTFPEPSFHKARHRSVAWAFCGLNSYVNPSEPDEELTGKYSDLLDEIPPGDNYLYFTSRRGHPKPLFRWRSKYWSFLLKLHPAKPSPTLPAVRITNNGPFHWENRRLRLREIARLQTFPDSYPLNSGVVARRHLGNAVPPLLSAQLFLALRKHLGLGIPQEQLDLIAEALHPAAPFSAVDRVLSLPLASRNHLTATA
jgi:DNA (cytosine-5)-methyltransferase 1